MEIYFHYRLNRTQKLLLKNHSLQKPKVILPNFPPANSKLNPWANVENVLKQTIIPALPKRMSKNPTVTREQSNRLVDEWYCLSKFLLSLWRHEK
jgi:hypothetical protein